MATVDYKLIALPSSSLLLRVSGEIDLEGVPILRSVLEPHFANGTINLAIDLTEIRYMDSSGLALLLFCHRTLAQKSGSFALVCPHKHLLKVLHITGLDRVFTIYADVDALHTVNPWKALPLDSLKGS
ncbi:MAG: STAS domain-containing protein [Candidatus Xenobia bacterium]